MFRFIFMAWCCIQAGIATVWAQKTFYGTVRDAETKLTLPAASVYWEGQNGGTVTNREGGYQIFAKTLPATLVIRFVGYETLRLSLTNDSTLRQEVALKPANAAVVEVEVTGEDPAVRIMKKVIDQKKTWQEGLNTYSTEVFSRFNLRANGELVQIIESNADGYWRAKTGVRELVRAMRFRPDIRERFRYAQTEPVANFYDDVVHLSAGRYLGVTHPDALAYYNFRIGTRKESPEETIVEIFVTPLRDYDRTFRGRILIRTNDYVMLEAELRPNQMPISDPITAFSISYKQHFINFGTGYWLPASFQTEGEVEVSRPGARLPRIFFSQVSRLTRFNLNVATPDSLYQVPEARIIEAGASERGYVLRYFSDIIPMTVEEYEAGDRGRSLRDVLQASGLLAGFAGLSVIDNQVEATDAGEDPNPVSQQKTPLGKMIARFVSPEGGLWYNRVDGLRIGHLKTIRFKQRSLRGWTFTPNAGLSLLGDRKPPTKNPPSLLDRLRYDVRSLRPDASLQAMYLNKAKTFEFQGYAGSRTLPRYTSPFWSQGVMSIGNLAGLPDYFDYYRATQVWVEGAKIFGRTHKGRASLAVQWENGRSVARQSNFKGYYFTQAYQTNPAITAGVLTSLKLKIQYGDRIPRMNTSGLRRIDFQVVYAPKADFQAANFLLLKADWFLSFETLLRNTTDAQRLGLRLVAQHAFGTLPLQRTGILDNAFLAQSTQPQSYQGMGIFGAFRSNTGRPMEGATVLGAFAEYDLKRSLWLPFERLYTALPYISLHAAAGYAGDSAQVWQDHTLQFSRFYKEAGLTFSRNQWLQISVTHSFSAKRWGIGFGIHRKF